MGGGGEWRWLGSDSSHVFLSQSVRKQKKPHLLFCKTPIVTHNLHVTKAERPVPLFKDHVLLNMLTIWEEGAGFGVWDIKYTNDCDIDKCQLLGDSDSVMLKSRTDSAEEAISLLSSVF